MSGRAEARPSELRASSLLDDFDFPRKGQCCQFATSRRFPIGDPLSDLVYAPGGLHRYEMLNFACRDKPPLDSTFKEALH